jgi:HK97 family phage major capsid protein
MTELEIKSQIEQLATETKSAVDFKITEATKEMATKSQIADLEAKASKIESLEAAMRSQGEELVALKSANQVNQSAKPKSVAEEIKSYLENNKEQWDAFRRGEVKSFGSSKDGSAIDLSVKASTMLVSTNTSGSAFVPRPVYEGGLIDLVRNTPFIEQYANTALVGSPRIIYTEKVNPDGDADFIGEGVLKPLIDFDIQTTTVYAKKVADKIKVSTEMLDDIDFMAAEINNELKYQVDIHTDDQLLAGTGDGSEANANLKGLTSFAGGYVLTTVETSTPNNFDAVRAAAAQIMSLNFSANYAFVNPIDAANMDLTKGDDGQYTIPPFKSATGMDIAGIRVVETNQIPVGFFLVGDMTKFKVRNYKPFAISMGWVNDDFEKNLVTIIGERRLASYVSVNHTGAFVYDSFADVKTAITAAIV